MTPMISQISLFAFNFPPAGWMFCDGALLPISENDALFMLIGNKFGGDGQETFAVPNIPPPAPNLHYCMSLFGTFTTNIYEGILGETMIVPGPLGAKNLMPCNGQMVAKSQYPLLDHYMGSRFGGDAAHFALPNLQSKAPAKCQYAMVMQGNPPDSLGMRSPFVAEIMLLPYQQSDSALMLCNGASLAVAQHQALYALIGTTYGGSGSNFSLPNLTSIAPTGYSYYIVVEKAVFPPRP